MDGFNKIIMIIKRDPKVGRYIISDKAFKKGEVVTISECIPLKGNHMPRFSTGSPLWQYVFQGITPDTQLVSLDWTSLMNHSEDPNLEYHPISDMQIQFTAAKDIEPGDELNINYGYDPLKHHSEVNSDMSDWNTYTATLHDAGAVGNMASSMSGNELANMVNKPNFTVLSKIRKKLEGAPRTTKEAFNTVLNYFASQGKCPVTGCIEQDSEGNWRIISNKTGEYWKQKYTSKEAAEDALKAYHANRRG